jgi:hypothetical protein
MKVGVVHILPVEYYPPTTNALELMAARGWDVRAWTSPNHRGLGDWAAPGVDVVRHPYSQPGKAAHQRFAGYGRWHFSTARELARWKPDVVFSIEPHSAIATWIYFRLLRQHARLFIHHHEYYAPNDYLRDGMRLARIGARLERKHLFHLAEWISETNSQRLNLLIADANLDRAKARVLPNYPPREWIARAFRNRSRNENPRKLIYVGSASLEDSFVGEIAQWAAARPAAVTLTVVGDNIADDVWSSLERLGAPNIAMIRNGYPYKRLPELLTQFDIGLILYRGNTQNFVYNIPNKAIEYLASGLEVWYPREMHSMRVFQEEHPDFPLVRIDFGSLGEANPASDKLIELNSMLSLSSETALAPLLQQIEKHQDAP